MKIFKRYLDKWLGFKNSMYLIKYKSFKLIVKYKINRIIDFLIKFV